MSAADAEAEAAYELIRQAGHADVEVVARNTGLSANEVAAVKKHIFYDVHELPLEDGSGWHMSRFQADDEVAYAWRLAQRSELTAEQQAWFRQYISHELNESAYMKLGVPYRDLEAFRLGYSSTPAGTHDLAPVPPKYGSFPGWPGPRID